MLDTSSSDSSEDSSESPATPGTPNRAEGTSSPSGSTAGERGAEPSRDKYFFYTPWYRFTLLLTGSETAALDVLRKTLEEGAGQLAEFRSIESKRSWLARSLDEKARALSQEVAGEPGRWAAVASLPAGERVAFALFHSFSLNVEKLAELSGHRARFADLLAKARVSLAPDAYFPVDTVLALHRPWLEHESLRVARKVRSALAGGEKTRVPLEAQIAFDREWHEALEAVRIPDGVELPDVMNTGKPSLLGVLRQPAVLAIAVAFLVVVGVVCFTALRRMEEFPGREVITELMQATLGTKGGAAESVGGVEAGTLEDWFLLKGFEGFVVPSELAKAKVESCEVFRFSGGEVARLNLQERGATLLVFRTVDLGVAPDAGVWTIYQEEKSAVAVKSEGPFSYVLSYEGDSREMNDFLRKLSL